jgi:hypothetical protein
VAVIDQIVARLAFDSGKVRGASNIGGRSPSVGDQDAEPGREISLAKIIS